MGKKLRYFMPILKTLPVVKSKTNFASYNFFRFTFYLGLFTFYESPLKSKKMLYYCDLRYRYFKPHQNATYAQMPILKWFFFLQLSTV